MTLTVITTVVIDYDYDCGSACDLIFIRLYIVSMYIVIHVLNIILPPSSRFPKRMPMQRPLIISNIPLRALRKRHIRLTSKEGIIFRRHRILEGNHIPLGEQLGPRLSAPLALTALKSKQQRIQPSRDLGDIKPGIGFSIVSNQVGKLVRIIGHIVQLMLVGTPDGVHEFIALRDDTQRLVRILTDLGSEVSEDCSLDDAPSPVLDIDMFVFRRVSGLRFRCHGHGNPVKVFVEGDTGELEQGRDDVGVGGGEGDLGAGSDAGTADGEGNVDVFFDVARLAGGEAVVADVVAVVAGVDDVGVCEDVWVGFEGCDDVVDDFVDGLEGLEAAAVVVVCVGDLGGVEAGEGLEVVDVAGLRSQ